MADPPLAPWLDKKPDKPAAPSAPDVPVAPWVTTKKPDAPAKSADVPDVPVAPWLTKPTGAKAAPAPPRAGTPAVPDAGGVAAPATPSASLGDRIAAAEKTNDIPPGLLNQVLTTESGFKSGAVNTQGSGATGIAQIMPATAKDPGYGIKPVNPNDPADSIRFAGQYLAALKKKTGSWAGAVRAYGSFASVVGPADQPLTNPQQAKLLAAAQAADQPSASTKPPPFQQPRDIARRAPPSTLGASADEIWKNFLAGMEEVPKAGAEAYRAETEAERKAGLPEALHYATAPVPAVVAEAGQAVGTVFNSAIETALAFAKDAGMDEAGLTRLRGDITQMLEVSQAAIPEGGGTPGLLHEKIKTTLEERAPPGTSEAFDKVSKDTKAAPPGGPPPGEPPFAGPPPGEPPAEPAPPTRAAITATQTALADRLHAHNQGVTADRIETMELGKTAQKAIPDSATREKLIHHQEQPDKVPLTPEEQALFDKHILPIIRAREWVQNKIADLLGKPHYPAWPAKREGEDIAHAPRFVKGKGSTIDWLLQGMGRRVGRQSLSKVGDKARTVPGPMIENPRIAYYKDAVVNNLVKLEESKRQLRNMEMLEHLKSTPELDHLREPTKEGGFGQTPGWKTAGPPQLAGIHWHPRIANAIDDAFKTFKRSGDAATFYAHVNRVLVGSMFLSPIGHILNVFTDTLISKGAIGTAVDLVTGRSFKAFGKAVREVGTLGKDYRANLRAGSSLQYGSVATENFVSDLVKGLEKQIKIDPKSWAEIARAGGYANPANLIAGVYRASRKFLWGAGDVLKLTRQYELEAEGMSRAQAIKETEKHIVPYRPPTEVAGQRWLSEVIQNPYIFSFSRYHHGLLHGLATTARDIAVGTLEERLRAVDSAIMMGVVYLGYRAADDQVRKLFGNKNASVKRSGIFGLEDVIEKFAEGDKDARDIVQRVASLNPVATLLATLYEGKDPYTGRDVLRGRDLWEHPGRFAKEIATVLGGKLMPIKEGIDLATGKASPQQEILKQINITDPDPSQAARARIARLKADRAAQRSLRRQFGN